MEQKREVERDIEKEWRRTREREKIERHSESKRRRGEERDGEQENYLN